MLKKALDFRTFLEPETVVIVGARRSPGFGYSIPISLINQGWGDRMHLVNPVGGELHGKPVFKSLDDLPSPVDLAVVIVPAPAVPGVMEDIGRSGVGHVILESAGFAETGPEGVRLQKQVTDIVKKYNMRVIGPNCVGVVNTANLFSTVEVVDEALKPGPLSVIAQSGMFGTGILDYLYEQDLYISKAVTLGNRMDVNECDVLDYLRQDPNTGVIMMYLEGADDGPRLADTLKTVTRRKPVLVLKSGRTREGLQATASHTGSMPGEDNLYEALFRQCGAVRARSIEELVDMAAVFASQPLPGGNRLGVVTSSGSLGVMATDIAVREGLTLPLPGKDAQACIRSKAPAWMNVKNPLDVGPSGLFGEALQALLEDPGIDMLMGVAVIPITVARIFKKQGLPPEVFFGDIRKIRASSPPKPFVLCVMGNSEFIRDMRRVAGTSTPVLPSPERSAHALAALWDYQRRRMR